MVKLSHSVKVHELSIRIEQPLVILCISGVSNTLNGNSFQAVMMVRPAFLHMREGNLMGWSREGIGYFGHV